MERPSCSQRLADGWTPNFSHSRMRTIASDPGALDLKINSKGEFLATAAPGRVSIWDVRTRAVLMMMMTEPHIPPYIIPQIHWSYNPLDLLVLSGQDLWMYSLDTQGAIFVFQFDCFVGDSVYDPLANAILLWRGQKSLSLSTLDYRDYPIDDTVIGLIPLPCGLPPALECNRRFLVNGSMLTSRVQPPLRLTAHREAPFLAAFNQHQCEVIAINERSFLAPEVDGPIRRAVFLCDQSILLLTGIASRAILVQAPKYDSTITLDVFSEQTLVVVTHPSRLAAYGLSIRGTIWSLIDQFHVEWMTSISPFGFRVIEHSEEYRESESEFERRPPRSSRQVDDLPIDVMTPSVKERFPFFAYSLPSTIDTEITAIISSPVMAVPSKLEFDRLYDRSH